MKDNGRFDFKVQGCLNRSDIRFWDKTHDGWFKLFGYLSPGVLVEAEIGSSEDAFEEKATCTFYPKDPEGKALIHVFATIAPARFNQIYQSLCHFLSRLEKIEVSIAYKRKPNSETECSVEELIFETCDGDYFSKSPNDESSKRGSWFSRR